MGMLKLYQVATPTSATQVTTTHTPVRQVIISNSGANATAFGDSTMTTASTGVQIASGQSQVVGTGVPSMGFDLAELYVIAATGNVNVLALMF